MQSTPTRLSHLAVASVATIALGAGCTPGGQAPERPPPAKTSRAKVAPEKGPEPIDGAFPVPLQSGQRSQFGAPPWGSAVDAGSLPPLSAEQLADPAAVSARLVLLQTNYWAAEDPAVVRARWTPYLVERMAEDLAASSGGIAALADLRAKDAVLVGDILGVTVVERSSSRASVAVTVRRSVVADGSTVRPARIDPWLVEVVLAPATGHWLVAGVERL